MSFCQQPSLEHSGWELHMYNKTFIYILELEAQGQKSYVVVLLGSGGADECWCVI